MKLKKSPLYLATLMGLNALVAYADPATCTSKLVFPLTDWNQAISFQCDSPVQLNGSRIEFDVPSLGGQRLPSVCNIYGGPGSTWAVDKSPDFLAQHPPSGSRDFVVTQGRPGDCSGPGKVVLNLCYDQWQNPDQQLPANTAAAFEFNAFPDFAFSNFQVTPGPQPMQDIVLFSVDGVFPPSGVAINLHSTSAAAFCAGNKTIFLNPNNYSTQSDSPLLKNITQSNYSVTATVNLGSFLVDMPTSPSVFSPVPGINTIVIHSPFVQTVFSLPSAPEDLSTVTSDQNGFLLKAQDLSSNKIQTFHLPWASPTNSTYQYSEFLAGHQYKIFADLLHGLSNDYRVSVDDTYHVTLIPIPVSTGTLNFSMENMPSGKQTRATISSDSGRFFSFSVDQTSSLKVPADTYEIGLSPIRDVPSNTVYLAKKIKVVVPKDDSASAAFEFSSLPATPFKNWPYYIAMGAVTDDNDSTGSSLASTPIDAIFKYDGAGGTGDPGVILYPLFTFETVRQADSIAKAHAANGVETAVIPVMVMYTAQMSGGTSVADFVYNLREEGSSNNLLMHYINLGMAVQQLESYYQQNPNSSPGSLVLNPDLFGMLQQQNLIPMVNNQLAVNAESIQKVLGSTLCFLSHNTTEGVYSGNYQEIFDKIYATRKTGYWDAYDTWNKTLGTANSNLYKYCQMNPADTGGITVPVFANNIQGWTQSTNWLIRVLGPHLTFGWQENLWSVGTVDWIHNNYPGTELSDKVTNSVVATIRATGAYAADQPAVPDYLVFDKYEQNEIPGAVADFLFNARDWTNYLNYAKQISEGIADDGKFFPVMLWQIPGGHLLQNGETSPLSQLPQASTSPDYFFGNEANPLINLQAWIQNIALSSANYGTTSMMAYLGQTETGDPGYTWMTSHMQDAADAHVFSILWGGGNTTSVGSFPSLTDDGWLAEKITQYAQDPALVKI